MHKNIITKPHQLSTSLVKFLPRGFHWGDTTPHKILTPLSTQNLKAMGLWALILIWCSTFSFLINVGLRLTLEFLTKLK